MSLSIDWDIGCGSGESSPETVMQIGAQIMLRTHPGSKDSPGLKNLPKVTELREGTREGRKL